MATIRAQPLCLKFDDWPMADQAAWLSGFQPGNGWDAPSSGANLREETRRSMRKTYGHWLAFLRGEGWLDPDVSPADRMTKPRRNAFIRFMRARNNADATIITRMSQLAMAMTVMAPGVDWAWIRTIRGVTIYRLLRNRRRPMRVPDPAVLYDWTRRMMDVARPTSDRTACLQYRDGLILAFLVACGRRLRSVSLLRHDKEVVRDGAVYRVRLDASQVKTHRSDSFPLPRSLTPYMEHYIAVVRPALLAGRQDDALWISKNGEQLAAKGIQAIVLKHTKAEFGWAFGPHRTRHGIVTAAAMHVPDYPELGADMLGISPEVAAKHYCLAQGTAASIQFSEMLERKTQAALMRMRRKKGA